MEERNSKEQASNGTGECTCKPFDMPQEPSGSIKSIRRLIKALEDELENIQAARPTDATKKFGDDLKDADKEYQGIADIVTKYETFYNQKLDDELEKAKLWKKEIVSWSDDEVGRDAKRDIKKLRDGYEAEEKKDGKCCEWLSFREQVNDLNDCLGQAMTAEQEAKDDNEAYKGFEKGLTDRFAELKSLFDKAEALWKAKKYKSVYAVRLEFDDVYRKLSDVDTWESRKKRCNGQSVSASGEGGQPTQSYVGQSSKPGTEMETKKPFTPDEFRVELTQALRNLIGAKYQRFRWQQQRLVLESDSKRFKDLCDKFRKSRRDQFIQEAEDVEDKSGGTQSGAEMA
ncbi:MAG TPA: hypothetical protein VF766_10675 [Pyrinomonadaceae bacterium]